MRSEQQKREEEIERLLLRGEGRSRDSDLDFQEKVRNAASAILKEQTSRIQREEKEEQTGEPEKVERPIAAKTAGLWLLLLGALLAFPMPILAGTLLLCGLAALLWPLLKPARKQPRRRRTGA